MSEAMQDTPLASVLYSRGGDLYRLPALAKDLWLSVQVYALADWGPGIGAVRTADDKAWRKGYKAWSIIQPGRFATLPADDPLVLDYAAAAE